MRLEVGSEIAASPFDEYYNMALFSCRDPISDYWFHLLRKADSDEIEIMVRDQVNCKTLGSDVTATLNRTNLSVQLSEALAKKLGAISQYDITFVIDDASLITLKASLMKIFEGTDSFRATV